MKILLVHNRYQQYGGEDATYESEKELLESHGHTVRSLLFDNSQIRGIGQRIKAGIQMIYNKESEGLLDKAIREFRPDLMHVHNFFYLASPSIFFAAEKNRVPIVVTLQNYRLICSGGLLMRNSEPCELCVNEIFPLSGVRYRCHRNSRLGTAYLTFQTGLHKLWNTWDQKITRYIAVTEFAKNKFMSSSLGLSDAKIVVKANSVADTDLVAVEQRENYYLFVGRLSKEKGIEVMLKAFENSNFQLEIIGDGPLRPMVEQAAQLNSNIRYSGYRDRTYIIERLKRSRAMIFPSLWYECLPVTILEAFSTGTPVIISNVGNLNEIVTNHYNGIHFSANNADDLRNVLSTFDRHPRDYVQLYLNARKTFVAKYTHAINYDNLMRIYRSAIEEKKH